MAIQMKATEQYFPVVKAMTLFKGFLKFKSVGHAKPAVRGSQT